MKLTVVALTLICLFSTGCGIKDPSNSLSGNTPTRNGSTPTSSAPSGFHASPLSITRGHASSAAALAKYYAAVSSNWRSSTIANTDRQLAALSTPQQAKSLLSQAGLPSSASPSTQQNEVSHRGEFVAIDDQGVNAGLRRFIVVLRESDQYGGVEQLGNQRLVVYEALIAQTRSGRFLVAAWGLKQ